MLDAAPRYRQRLVELAAGAVLSEALAPEVCIAPRAAAAPFIEGQWHHALCFVAAPLFTHEFYPLAVDALARDAARHGRPRFALLGTHLDWLDRRGRISRMLCLDAAAGCLRETELLMPLAPHSAQFLCLGAEEQLLHAQWSARLQCPQVNPAAAAQRADDKGRTLEGWAGAGLRVPAWQRWDHGGVAGARRALERHPEVVIKPNWGTEGQGVAFFRAGDEEALAARLALLPAQEEVLLQQRADAVCYRDPHAGTLHSLALRLNVSCAEGVHTAESGYAQVGAGPDRPAAASQGSECRTIDEVLPHLVRRQGGQPVAMSDQAWAAVLAAAEAGARLFDDLLLVGVDLVLALTEAGEPEPVLLEANPRPAGLSHSRFVQGPERGLPGVSLRMWDGLERLASDAGAAGKDEWYGQ